VTRGAARASFVMTLAATLHAVSLAARSVVPGSFMTGRTSKRETRVTGFVVMTGTLIVARARALSLTREAGE
jgi:hypothetical protein